MHHLLCFLAGLLLTLGAAEARSPIAIADDVHVFPGDTGEPSIANEANTANSSFIVAAGGVIVIDTGASYRHGTRMLEAIAQRTMLPVRLVVVTNAVQDFLFGNAAFAERGLPILAHEKSAELMRSRCAHCLANLVQLLGEERMRGTRLVLPDRLISASQPLDVAGRHLELYHFGWGATPGDLVVFDPHSGVLFTGGLLSVGRIPDLRDGRLHGWLDALDRLERIPARLVVPGHGEVAPPTAIAMMRAYLLALDARVRELYESGRSLLEALDECDLPAFRDWAMYAALHRKNVQQRYLELELQELEAR